MEGDRAVAQQLTIVNVGTNICGFANTSGVTELGSNIDLPQWGSLTLLYVTDRFVKI